METERRENESRGSFKTPSGEDMRVLMIVSNDVVHDSRPLKEAAALRSAGHTVAFIGWDRSGTRPPVLEHDGMRIDLVRTRGLLRALGSDLVRNPVWWRQAYRLARRADFDVVHCHDLDTLPVGVRIKRRLGRPLVYDLHEVFGYMIADDVPRAVVNYAFRMERKLARAANRVIAVTESVKRYIDTAAGTDAVIVRNTEALVNEAYIPPPNGPFTITYVGTLHANRFLLPAIEVVGEEMPDVRLVIGGSKRFTPQVRAACARHPNTEYIGLVAREDVMPRTIASHAVLSMVDPNHRNYQFAVANKVYEAMAAGRPSIVTEGLFMAELVEHEACGLAVPYTKDGFREAVRRLREEPGLAERLGRNGLEAARRQYNWERDRRALIALYEGMDTTH